MTSGPDDQAVPDETGADSQTPPAEPQAAEPAATAEPAAQPAAESVQEQQLAADSTDVPTPPPVGEPTPPPVGETPPPPAWEVPPPVEQAPQPGVRYDVPQDQKNLAMLSTLGMLIVGFLSPLIVFAVTNGDPGKRFANDHAKEGLNFSITVIIAGAVTALLALLIIGFLLIPLLIGWSLWVIIAGTIQASNGEAPHYPLVPKILK